MRAFIFIWCIGLFLPCSLDAGTHTAATCSYSDVLSAYNAAAAGDTVAIPSGSCTWTSQLTISKSITLQGAGSSSTTINHNFGSELVYIRPSSDVPIRISGIHFSRPSTSSGKTFIYPNIAEGSSWGMTQFRVDNCKFTNGTRAIHVRGWVYGVIDNNTFLNCNIGVGISSDNNYSWSRPIAAGTVNALFIEDNTFTVDNNADMEPNQQVYHQEGARTVTRYNTFDGHTFTNGNFIPFDSHGNQNYYKAGGDFRGQPIIEVYENTFHAHHTYLFVDLRGGSNIWWNNKFVYDAGGTPSVIQLWEEEAWQTAFFSTLKTSWPAEDQITNSFFWNNTLNGSAINPEPKSSKESNFIQVNRDYFLHPPQASGGRENYTGRAGGAMTFSSSGANAYYPYTPYIYPHPLVSGIKAPTGLKIVTP